jgi:hypothetical protein
VKVPETLVKDCLFNWIGYGELNSPVWIMGMEEGVLEMSSGAIPSLIKSLKIRLGFGLTMDFMEVWRGKYNGGS